MQGATPQKAASYAFFKKTLLWLFLGATAIAFYGAYFTDGLRPNTEPKISGWGFFHYYLGAKYFPEIGYFAFYECAVEAGRAAGVSWNEQTAVRDLRTYRLSRVEDLAPCAKENFGAERWQAFQNDIRWIIEKDNREFPRERILELITDKGFNAPPFWIAAAQGLLKLFPSAGNATIVFLTNIDLILILLSVLLIWQSSGERLARITFALILLYFGTLAFLGGQFLQYVWFFGLTAAVAAFKAGRPVASGVLSGLSFGFHSFPLFFALPLFASAGFAILRRQPNAALTRFMIASLITMALCVGVGSFSGKGFEGWKEWRQKISLHSHYLRGEIFDIGLPVFISTVATDARPTGHSYEAQFPQAVAQLSAYEKFKILHYAIAAILIAWWLWLLWRTREKMLFGYGIIPMFALVALSPFYYLAIALLPFMFSDAPARLRRYVTYGTLMLVLLNLPSAALYGYISFYYLIHLFSGTLLSIFILGLLLLWHAELRKQKAAEA